MARAADPSPVPADWSNSESASKSPAGSDQMMMRTENRDCSDRGSHGRYSRADRASAAGYRALNFDDSAWQQRSVVAVQASGLVGRTGFRVGP